MNQNYKSLYNRALGAWVAAPENARRAGKKSKAHVETKRSPWATLARLLVLSPALLGGGLALAAPVVTNGTQPSNLIINPNPADPSQAVGRDDIAIGRKSTANSGLHPSDKYGAIAIGGESQSLSKETIAIGRTAQAAKSQGIAIGAATQAQGDQSTALGNNVVSQGDSSVAIGGDDLDTVSAGGGALNSSATAQDYKNLTGDDLVNAGQRYRATTTGAAAVAVGVQSQASGSLSTAFGTKTTASGLAATALGVGANASKDNAVALGSGSTTTANATIVNDAEVGTGTHKIVYSGFAGGANIKPGDQVSVGSAGYERQIKHVAPGAINATSTDAINGSQLHAVIQKAQHHYYSVNDNGTPQDNYSNDGATGVNALAAGVGTKASTDAGTAVGAFAEVQGKYGVAIGGGDSASVRTVAKGEKAVAVGYNANTAAENAIAIGTAATVAAGTANADSGTVTGQGSVAIGAASAAKGTNATALGQKAEAFGQNSLAAGQDSHATGKSSVALGDGAKGSKDSATAVGVYANAAGPGATALGASTQADQWGSTAVGLGAQATNSSSATAVGHEAKASAINALASGAKAKATGKNSVATGFNALASNDGAVAVGSNTQATNASTAMGDSSKATGLNSTALGWQANAAGRADVYIGKQAGFGTSNSGNFDNVGIGEGAARNAGSASQAVTNVVAIGTGAAEGIQESHNIAIGAYANGTGSGNAQVTTGNNIAIGQRAYAKGGNSIALGQRTKAEGSAALAFGVSASAGGANSLAAGQLADASGVGSVAIGGAAQTANAARASGTQAIAIGQKSNATGDQATAMGVNAQASGNAAVAVGKDNNVSGNGSGALGSGNTVGQENSFVLGKDVTTSQANSVVLGNASTDRAATAETQATVNGITYSGFAGVGSAANGVVSVGKRGGERQLINVAAGNISATSTDAINGSQLYLTQQALGNVGSTTASVLGGNATMANDGKITMSNVGNTGKNTVHDAIEAVNNTAKAGWNLQVNNGSSENVKPNDTVKFKDGNNIAISNNGKEITIATKPDLNANSLTINNGGPVLNSGGINMNSKKITNLAAGTADGDGVNVSQLKSVATALGGGATIKSDGSFQAPSYTLTDGNPAGGGTTTYNNVGAALNGLNTAVNKPLTFAGDSGTAFERKLGSQVAVQGGVTDASKLSDGNIGVVANNGTLNVKLAKDLNVNSVKTGNSTLNNDGLTIAGGPSVTSTGINAGGKKITNVQAGTANTDAVNVAQLNQAITNVNNNVAAAKTHYYSVKSNVTGAGSNYNNDGATGTDALAAGVNASAAVNESVAIGKGAKTTGTGSGATAIGRNASANGQGSTSIGINARSDDQSIAIGTNANNRFGTPNGIGSSSVAIGNNTVSSGKNSVATGNEAIATRDQATAVGFNTKAYGKSSVALGDSAISGVENDAEVAQTVAVGVSSQATGHGSTALGSRSQSSALYGTALGISSNNNVDFGVALGALSTTEGLTVGNAGYVMPSANTTDKAAVAATKSNAAGVSIGGKAASAPFMPNGVSAGDEIRRQIHYVAAGTANTDAVNVAQLKAAQTHYYSVNDNGTQVNNYNNDGATGTNALAAGTSASAAGNGAVAVGHGATAMGERSQASGYQATAFSQSSVASGDNASAVGVNAVASGTNATTDGLNARAEGTNASATATNASASGTDARASAENALASGTNASATAANAVASGSNASATASGGVALGANASADRAAISGASTSATASAGANQVYANDNAEAADKSAILATVSGNQGAVSVGQAGQTRQIINLAAGSNDSDAVNVAQLKAVAKVARGSTTHVTNTTNVYQTTIVEDNTTVSAGQGIRINRSGKNYQVALADDVGVNSLRAGDTVVNANGLTIGGTNYVGPNGLNGGGRVIGGVAPGRIAPDSDEAVNGAQLARVYDDLEGKDAGIASAMATANLPQVYLPGKSMVGVGVANYNGQSALAVGLSALSDNGKWVIRGSVNANKKKVGVGAGVGYQW